MTQTTVFDLQAVSYGYSTGNPVLRDITLTVAAGERIALLGANGCGKSTLLKIMDGLLFPQSGSFRAFGEEISEAALREENRANRFRRRVGFVFQNADSQLFSPTVREELAFGPLHLGLSHEEAAQRVADTASLLELVPLLDRSPYQLSGGEKRRVALACVLTTAPEVLLLDEPTTGLDPRSRHALVDMLNRLHQVGKTLVLCTHDLELLPMLADRAVVLNEEHAIETLAPVAAVLEDTALLRRVNLIHEHGHWHGTLFHSHPHHHDAEHAHPHEAEPSPLAEPLSDAPPANGSVR